MYRYTLFIEEAIASCEVADCKENSQVQASVQPTPLAADKFDQLKKLKALLDGGAINQVEYDEQKKKLLN